MGKISPDTFNQSKQYVNVRLQQGVPIVDADWNEMDDIRKHEHQTFIRTVVGDGVPQDSDSFKIEALANGGINTLILTAAVDPSGSSTLKIDLVQSTAATALGFDATNQQATGKYKAPAQLTSHHAEPFTLSNGMTLVVKVNNTDKTITFQGTETTAAEVITAINNIVPQLATAGMGNDFRILGGTPEQPGLCLVEGWEIQISASLNYTAQLLYNNAELATKWQVAPLFPLIEPALDRVDTVYLDAWERLVDSTDDPDLLNPLIGIETCLRRKREWVVRVAENSESLPEPPPGHAYYPLARLTRPANQAVISAAQLTDLRTPMAMARQSEVEQLATDAFGSQYPLSPEGQPHLKISLREAINALLRGTIPTTPVTILTTATFEPPTANYQISAVTSFTDSQKMSWVFWSTSGYDPNKQVNKTSVWYKRYDPSTQQWEPDQELSTAEQSYGNYELKALADQQGNIWLVWETSRNDHTYIYSQRYLRAEQQWEGEQRLTDDKTDNYQPVAIKDLAGNIWVFWSSYRPVSDGQRDGQWNYDIYYRRYTGSWEAEQRLTTATEDDYSPTATVDSGGNIQVFWQSYRQIGSDIYYKIYYTSQQWSGESQITYDDAYDQQPLAFTTSRGETWVFWVSNRMGSWDIWYRRNWGNEIQLNTGTGSAWNFRVIEDSRGDIWVFWYGDNGQVFYKHYSGTWGLTTQLTTNWSNYFSATESHAGDIWTFVAQNHDIQHQQLIAVI